MLKECCVPYLYKKMGQSSVLDTTINVFYVAHELILLGTKTVAK